jgi:threonine aldolase
MRQAGIIAAASLYAFENNIERLAEDHERAKRLADGLREAGYGVDEPETNIVLVEVGEPGAFLRDLAGEGVLATPWSGNRIRLCTHLDVGNEVEAVPEAFLRASAARKGARV